MTEDFPSLSPLSHHHGKPAAGLLQPAPFASRKKFGTMGRLMAGEGMMWLLRLLRTFLVELFRLCAAVVIWFGQCNIIRGKGVVSEPDFFVELP
jgi:hypothetical protein